MELLTKLSLPARNKIKQLSKKIMKRIKEDEMFAAKIVLNSTFNIFISLERV